MGESSIPQAIRSIIVSYAEKLKNEDIAPCDLRRTFAKLAHKGDSPIKQIQLSLGLFPTHSECCSRSVYMMGRTSSR